MSTVHFVLQGKGGVGKSLISSFLIQYIKEENIPVLGVDTDPVNSTLTGYTDLDIQSLDIMVGDDVDQRKFDFLIETIFQQPADSHIIVDNGAASFIPLCSYLKENNAIPLLQDSGHTVLLHSVITGGQAIGDTVSGLGLLVTTFSVPVVVWLNRFFGDITTNDKTFEEFKVYKEFSDKFQAVIEIPNRKKSTFGKDLEEHFSKQETFETAINSDLPIMARQRLKMFWVDLQAQIAKAHLI